MFPVSPFIDEKWRLTCPRSQLMSGIIGIQTRSSVFFSSFSDCLCRAPPWETHSVVRDPECLPAQWFFLRDLTPRVITPGWIPLVVGSSRQPLRCWIALIVRKLLLHMNSKSDPPTSPTSFSASVYHLACLPTSFLPFHLYHFSLTYCPTLTFIKKLSLAKFPIILQFFNTHFKLLHIYIPYSFNICLISLIL